MSDEPEPPGVDKVWVGSLVVSELSLARPLERSDDPRNAQERPGPRFQSRIHGAATYR
jgi:hypothetical protein